MIYQIKNKTFSSNTYILTVENSNECLVVDPGLDTAAIEEKLSVLRMVPSFILATHGHFDHVGTVSYFQKKYGSKFYIHELDVKLLKTLNFFLKIMKIDMRVDQPHPDHLFSGEYFVLTLGNVQIEVYNLPGHSDGSCLFKVEDILFSGDTLYSKGVGVNPFPGQDTEKLKTSVKKIFDLFPDDATVYPGHGTPSKLGTIKSQNQELKEFLELI